MSNEEQNSNPDSPEENTSAESLMPEGEILEASIDLDSDEFVEDVSPAALVAENDNLKLELDKAKDQAVRAMAEMQNVSRRAKQDVEKAHKFGLEKFAGDVLAVADNLERALTSMDADDDHLKTAREGIELTHKALLDALTRHSVEQINPTGEPFNPEFHQAMAMVPNPDMEPNTVMEVFQPGYTLNGRLLRPAMVVVAKAP